MRAFVFTDRTLTRHAGRFVWLSLDMEKAQNAAAIFAKPDVDGGLIGGASLVAEEFLAICRAGQN